MLKLVGPTHGVSREKLCDSTERRGNRFRRVLSNRRFLIFYSDYTILQLQPLTYPVYKIVRLQQYDYQ